MIYRGHCHCGAVSVTYQTSAPVTLRQDGCSFCASRGVKYASEPQGSIQIHADQALVRYRFGHKTADFLICPTCGTYVGTMMEDPDGPVGVINVVGLAIPELKDLPATLASLDGETRAERTRRRRARWASVELSEPG